MNSSICYLKFTVFFLLLLSFLKIKALQQLESANSFVENTSCSSLVVLALWDFLSNMNRHDSEDRGRTTVLCRKLKNGAFAVFLANTTVKLQCLPSPPLPFFSTPPFPLFCFTLLDSFWNWSWYPELILTINTKSTREQTRCSQQPVFFFQKGCTNKEVEGWGGRGCVCSM